MVFMVGTHVAVKRGYNNNSRNMQSCNYIKLMFCDVAYTVCGFIVADWLSH